MARFEDDTPMPFGKFKGAPLKDVDSGYLLWLYNKMLDDDDKVRLFLYIHRNKAALEAEEVDSKPPPYDGG